MSGAAKGKFTALYVIGDNTAGGDIGAVSDINGGDQCGIGAYKTNPQSVRPSVSSADQWAMARVNSFLFALRNQKYKSGKHDTDLLPEDHDMSEKKKTLELRSH